MRAFFKRVSRWLSQRVVPHRSMDSQMQRITSKLIKKSVGPWGSVTWAFIKQSRRYSVEKNPIGRDEAMNILVGLVHLAVAKRSMLEGNIVDRVENGLLYSDFYRDVEDVLEMATKADEAYRKAEMIREDYATEYGFYLRNRMESYRKGGTNPLSEDDLEELKKKIDKLNRLTGFGGEE